MPRPSKLAEEARKQAWATAHSEQSANSRIVPSSLLARFFYTFFKEFFTTMREEIFDKIVLGAGVIYFLGHRLITERWEVVVPLVWSVCVMVVYHAFKAAYIVSRNITAETIHSGAHESIILTATGERASFSLPSVTPTLYRFRLSAIACAFLCSCGFICFSVWERSRASLPVKHEIEGKGGTKPNETPPPQPGLTEIQKTLDEINKNLVRRGHPQISGVQMDAIKELDQFIVGRDEMALREAFGFPLMMEKNIRMNITIVSHFKRGTPREISKNVIGHETIVDSGLAEGHIRRWGGSFLIDQFDGTRVYALMLPEEYSSGKKQLLKFETSLELPAPVIKAVKNFDDVVYKNADGLLHVLNSALKKDPDYYLRYDDQGSPTYFHQLDAMWLDNFIQLRPEADKIRDAIRQFLGVAAQPAGADLEVIAFRSDYGISIANNGPLRVHIFSLLVQGDTETKSIALGLDIAPGKISEEKIHDEGFLHSRSLVRLADTWEEHVKKARELFSACGMRWAFFSPLDVSLQQIKDTYTGQGVTLGYKEISGVLYYRAQGSHETEHQIVPIVETIVVNDDSCPRVRLESSR